MSIDYIYADGKQIANKLRGEPYAISKVLTSQFRISRSSPLKKEPFSEEMHSKISRSGCRLKLPNF
jgi:hypothetical protein